MKKWWALAALCLIVGSAAVLATSKDSPPQECTDENGVIFHKGQTGFENCVDAAQREKQQQSGKVAEALPSSQPTDTSTSSARDD